MIPAEVLRVGNRMLLNSISEEKHLTVQEIRSTGVFAYEHTDGGDTFVKFEDLAPINLTAKWLVRCGFHVDIEPGDDGSLVWNYDREEIYGIFNQGEGKFSYLKNIPNIFLNVFHLHHLQNVFYFTVGKELILKHD